MGGTPSLQQETIREALQSSSVLVIDCRSRGEYSAGDGYAGAVNIPVDEVPRRLSECGSDKARPIVVYCRSGFRSSSAADILRQNGYANVISAANANALRSALK
jgi:rhodanese-related sulfurtransferase